MSANTVPHEGFPEPPEGVLDPEQLFPTDFLGQELYGSTVYAIGALDKTWVAIDQHAYEPVNPRSERLRLSRSLLNKALGVHVPRPWDQRPWLSEQLYGGRELGEMIDLLEQTERIETGLDGSGIPSLREEVGTLLELEQTRLRESQVAAVASLNIGITYDTSDIMLGVYKGEGDENVTGAAKLESVYVSGGENRPSVMPALSGRDGTVAQLGEFSLFGVFLEASPKGKRQVQAKREERTRIVNSMAK